MYEYHPEQTLVLASGSPRRRELLEAAGIPFTVHVSNVEELVEQGEAPQRMVERLACLKGEAVARQHADSWVLAADTTVLLGTQILNKPADEAEAVAMLTRLQNRTHEVWGGIALLHHKRGICAVRSIRTMVRMSALDQATIRRYVSTGEPMDKAGSYAVQGIGAQFVQQIDGSYTNVVGLDLPSVVALLLEHNVVRLRA